MVLISRGFTEGCTILSRGIMWTKGDSQHSVAQREEQANKKVLSQEATRATHIKITAKNIITCPK